MILQNKQTGVLGALEATTYYGGRPDNIIEVYEMGMGAVKVLAQYKTLEELLEEWEDYKPKEPLIKDEKKHKIIRACASLDSVEDVKVVKRSSDDTTTLIFGKTTLTLKGREEYASLRQCGTYSIAELCGEEEECES